MKQKKRLIVVCTLFATLFSVTACGGSSESVSSPTTESAVQEADAADTTEAGTEQTVASALRPLTLTEVGSIKEFESLSSGIPCNNDTNQYYTVNGDPIGVYDYTSPMGDCMFHDFTASSVTEYLGEGVFRVKVEGDLDTYWTANGGSYTIKPSADGNSATIVSDDGTKTTVTARSYNTYCTQDGDGLKYFNWNTGEMDIHATDNKYSRYDLDTSLTRQEGDLLAVPAENGEYKIYDVFGGEVIWNGPAYEVKGNNRFVYIYDGNTEVYAVYRIDFA